MPTPIDWDVDSPYDLEDVQREVDRQRIGLGMKPQRDEQAEREASPDWRSTKDGDYNKSMYVAVDLGKKADHTALTLIEPFLPKIHSFDSLILGHKQFIYHVSKIKRYDLETPYPVIARALKKLDVQLRKKKELEFIYYVIDQGGVGIGVTDQVVELIPNADVYRVTLTGGARPRWEDSRTLSLPKPQMSSLLISLFEADRIWIAGREYHAGDLKQELLNYEHKVTNAGYDQFGSIKSGEHDDIVSALGIGIWVAENAGGGAVPLFW